MKTVKFYKSGTTVRVFDYDDNQVIDKLPSAIYTVCQDMGGYFLSFVSDKFDVPNKIYGSTNARADKILKTYDGRTRSTGVLMSGDKGSGKTMLSSLLSNKMLERDLPVILIEKPFTGTGFIDFLNNIGECVLFFDEFAKVFSKVDEDSEENKSQDGLLSVFDGAHTIKRLILLTENETYNINKYMLNRPGRIFYHFKYSKLEEALVREYCTANNIPDDIVEAILLRIESSGEFSFDALKAVVEDYTRFGGDISEIFQDLNIEEPKAFSKKMKVLKIVSIQTGNEFKAINDEVSAPTYNSYTRIDFAIPDVKKKSKKLQKQPLTIEEQLAQAITQNTPTSLRGRVNVHLKDLVERSGNINVYECKGDGYIVVLEKITEQVYTDYQRYLDSAYDD